MRQPFIHKTNNGIFIVRTRFTYTDLINTGSLIIELLAFRDQVKVKGATCTAEFFINSYGEFQAIIPKSVVYVWQAKSKVWKHCANWNDINGWTWL